MRRAKVSLLAALTAALCFAQTTTLPTEAPSVERVAAKLKCNCGCNLNMDCKMDPWPCHVCRAGKEKIVVMQKAGMSDAAILQEFVKEEGPAVLVVEPGMFGSLSHYFGLGVGLLLVVWFIRRQLANRAAPAAPADAELLKRYHDAIEKETARLD